MKTELKKESKKAAVVMLNGRLNLTTTDMIAVELKYLKRLLESHYGRTVHYVSHKTRKDKDNQDYKDITETRLSDYDEVFIYNSSMNLFGGAFSMACLQTFKQLLSFKGTIYWILSDPRFPCLDFSYIIRHQLNKNNGVVKVDGKERTTDIISIADCDKWSEKVFPHIITAFNGFDYDLYCDKYFKKHKKLSPRSRLPEDKNWCEFTFFQYFGRSLLDDKSILEDRPYEDKKYDLCYYGINRRNERNAIIADLYSAPKLKKLFIGFDGIQLPNTDRIERVQREDLFETISKNSIATVVIGDEFHNDNCITFRFYEAMLLDCAALIYDDFDTKRRLVKSKLLQDFIFVKTAADVEDRISKLKKDKALYKKIVKLERAEIKRLLEGYEL